MVRIEPDHIIGFLKSQVMIFFMITTGSLNSQDIISQVSIYGKDIAWILCDVYVCSSKFNRGSYGFVKFLYEYLVSRLDFVYLPIADQLQPNFYRRLRNRGLQN